jgi:hypothetical protein
VNRGKETREEERVSAPKGTETRERNREKERETERERTYKEMMWGRAREESALLIRRLKILFVEKVG